MNLLRRRLPTAAAATFALLILAAMAAPLATALETDTTLVDDTTGEVTGDTTVVDDPSPSPTDDGSLDSTTQTTGDTVDSTTQSVTSASEDLEETVRGVVSPSEEPGDPSDEPSEGSSEDDGTTGETDDDATDEEGTSEEQADQDAAASDDGSDGSDTRGAGTSTQEADRPADPVAERRANLREAAAQAWLERLMSWQAREAGTDGAYGGTAAWSLPVRPVDAIDPASVFSTGQDLSAPVFGGLQLYDRSYGKRSTHDLLDRLSGAGADLATAAKVLAPFPVVGPATYTDDWHYPRDGGARLHKGTDIFAPRGTPIVASADGVIGRIGVNSGLGGNTIGLYADDGTYFYYAHLDAFAENVRFNLRVAKGDVIGFVGTSGNAAGTPPHLHFQIHPDNGAAVPPVDYLDRWLEEARAKVLLVRDRSGTGGLPTLVAPPAAGSVSVPDVAEGVAQDATTGEAAAADQLATSPTGYTRQEDTSQSIAVFLALTGVAWYLLRRRSVFAGVGASAGSEPAPVPDVLEPVLTVEDVIRAGEGQRSASGERDVLEPVLAGRGAEPQPREDDGARRDVLADILR